MTTKLSNATQNASHMLSDKWTLWAHLPNMGWRAVSDFSKIHTATTMEEVIALMDTLPNMLIENCMLFFMRDNITPIWEEPRNRDGGYFSYKVLNKNNVSQVWRELSYVVAGETVSNDIKFLRDISGITISPKKNFCIIKIWMTNCVHQSASAVTADIKGLNHQGCLFGAHCEKSAYVK